MVIILNIKVTSIFALYLLNVPSKAETLLRQTVVALTLAAHPLTLIESNEENPAIDLTTPFTPNHKFRSPCSDL